jgi:hypothetical protein
VLKTTRFVAFSLIILILVSAAPASAQATRVEPAQVLSTSPILLMWKWINVDYERKIAPAFTLGASASYLPGDGSDYARATFHARFYPERSALTGFYFGGQAGVHRTGDDYRSGEEVFFGAGMDVGYAWVLGPNRDVGASVGFGTTRVFAGDHRGGSYAIPNLRLLNVGFAF